MSQSGTINNAVIPPGTGVQTLTGNTGGAVGPDGANNIDILGGDGVLIDGNPGTNTLVVSLVGSEEGTGTTIGAVTADIITIPLGAVATTYTFEARVAGFESTTPAGCGYQLIAMFRTDGAAATQIGTTERVANEEAALVGANADFVASANNVILRVTGVALLTISWKAFSVYTREI